MKVKGPDDLAGIVLKSDGEMDDALERKLGLGAVVIISLSAMLGSGLFVLPALAMLEMGGGTNPVGGVWLAYLLAAIIVLPAAVSKSELATAMPTSGGSYVYIERGFGPLFGTMMGLALWASFLLKAAFALIGFSAYLMFVQAEYGEYVTSLEAALGMLVIISIVNILGIKRVKVVQTPIVAVALIFLIGLTIMAVINGDADWSRIEPTLETSSDWIDMGETAALVLVSYAGVTTVSYTHLRAHETAS